MAKKATTKTAAATAAHHDLPPAMDYKQHEATWNGFVELTKLSIISIAILVVGLYCVIHAGQPLLGVILVILSVIVPVVIKIMGGKRMPAH